MSLSILSPHCGIAAETTSGAEVFERELLRRIAEKHSVHLILTPKAYRAARMNFPCTWKVTPGRLPMVWWLAPLILLDAMRGLERPDILRVHSLLYIGPSALYARRVFWPGVPVIAHHHHLDAGWHPIERYVSNRMDRVIVGSEFAKRQMAGRGWRTDHVRVVPYAVDERFKPVDRSGRKTVNVLYLGGLKKRKNVELLLRIWPDVARACPRASLWIAGDGPMRKRLEWMAQRVRQAHGELWADPMSSVYFLGYVPEADKPRVYQDADVFVFPSHMEGFGLPVLEAMASGLPVLHSGAGSLNELSSDSWIAADEWIEHLTWLCRDAKLRGQIGESNTREALTYSWDRCARETLAVYEEAIRGGRDAD